MEAKSFYIPDVAVLRGKKTEKDGSLTLECRFLDVLRARTFTFQPGQVMLLSVLGFGEEAYYLVSSPAKQGELHLTVPPYSRLFPIVTRLEPGSMVGLRGPVGRGLPVEEIRGKHLYLIGEGPYWAPLRAFADYAVDAPGEVERVSAVGWFGEEEGVPYDEEFRGVWAGHAVFEVHLCAPGEGGSPEDWLAGIGFSPRNALALVSGSPRFVQAALRKLEEADFRDAQILIFLHRKYGCGYGVCQTCRLAHLFPCLEGPLFPVSTLRKLPVEVLM